MGVPRTLAKGLSKLKEAAQARKAVDVAGAMPYAAGTAALLAGATPQEAEAGPLQSLGRAAPYLTSAALGGAAALQSGDAEAGIITRGGKKLIEAWHGGPHTFPAERLIKWADGRMEHIVGGVDSLPDVPAGAELLQDYPLGRMRMDKIGTGEGAQAYGHGLYSADAQDTAKEYQKTLARQSLEFGDGTKLTPSWDDPRFNAAKYVQDAGGDFAKARELAASETTAHNWQQDILLSIDEFERKGAKVSQGALYRTEIDVDPDTLLDWDKPLSEQQGVMERLARLQTPTGNMAEDAMAYFSRPGFGQKSNPTGSDLMGFLQDRQGGAQYASAATRQAGIPGIRYLDGVSRTNTPPSVVQDGDKFAVYWGNDPRPVDRFNTIEEAQAAAQELDTRSYNYVMFDDKPISIVERGNATPALLAATAVGTGAGMAAADAFSAQPDPSYDAYIRDAMEARTAAESFAQMRGSKAGYWEARRQELLDMVNGLGALAGEVADVALMSPTNRAMYGFASMNSDKIMHDIDMPLRSLLAGGGVIRDAAQGQSLQNIGQNAQQIVNNPSDQTTYRVGGAVTDALAPYTTPEAAAAAGALTNAGIQMLSPI